MSFASTQPVNFFHRIIVKKRYWFLFCLFFFSYPIYRSMNRVLPAPLPVLFTLPQYEMLDENNKPFGSKDLKGKPYIASFFFTTCPTVCLETLKELQRIQKRVKGLGDHVALVSFTVDPNVDTPQVLFRKARELEANPFVWKFLTSSEEQMKDLLVNHFKVPMEGKEKNAQNIWDIAHSSKFALVDQEGNILKYYSLKKVEIDQMMIDLGLLVNRHRLTFKGKGE